MKNDIRKPRVLSSPHLGRWVLLIKKNKELIKDETVVTAPECVAIFCMGLLFKNTLAFSTPPPSSMFGIFLAPG